MAEWLPLVFYRRVCKKRFGFWFTLVSKRTLKWKSEFIFWSFWYQFHYKTCWHWAQIIFIIRHDIFEIILSFIPLSIILVLPAPKILPLKSQKARALRELRLARSVSFGGVALRSPRHCFWGPHCWMKGHFRAKKKLLSPACNWKTATALPIPNWKTHPATPLIVRIWF